MPNGIRRHYVSPLMKICIYTNKQPNLLNCRLLNYAISIIWSRFHPSIQVSKQLIAYNAASFPFNLLVDIVNTLAALSKEESIPFIVLVTLSALIIKMSSSLHSRRRRNKYEIARYGANWDAPYHLSSPHAHLSPIHGSVFSVFFHRWWVYTSSKTHDSSETWHKKMMDNMVAQLSKDRVIREGKIK